MYDFTYVKPATVEEAVAAMGAEGAQALSGGQTLTPTMKQRLAQPGSLVDLTAIQALKGVEVAGDAVTIKAATRHVDVASSSEVQAAIPSLAALAGQIGDPQVRNRGTLGGSVANNDPSACYPSAVLALDGVVITNAREIAAADFFQGLFGTALEAGEMITAIRFRKPDAGAYRKFVQPASRFALTGVFVARFGAEVRVAVTGASDGGVFRHGGLEQALSAQFDPAAVDSVAVSADGMIGDLHGAPEYRAHLVKVMTKRAVQDCLSA